MGPWRAARAEAMRLAVVVHKDASLDGLPLALLRALYLGDPVGERSGRRLVPLNLPPRSPVRMAFDRAVLGMGLDEIARYWIGRRIRGQGSPPRTVPDPELMQRLVASLSGIVGYVPAEALSGQVKVLAIDGKSPGDSAYPLVARAPLVARELTLG